MEQYKAVTGSTACSATCAVLGLLFCVLSLSYILQVTHLYDAVTACLHQDSTACGTSVVQKQAVFNLDSSAILHIQSPCNQWVVLDGNLTTQTIIQQPAIDNGMYCNPKRQHNLHCFMQCLCAHCSIPSPLVGCLLQAQLATCRAI